ncbi:MAG: carbohydrate-binding protein [Bacteroidota bacterium]
MNNYFKISFFFLTCFLVCQLSAQDWNGISVPADAGPGNTWKLQEAPSDDFNYVFNETSQLSNFGSNKWYNFYHNPWNGPGTTYWQYNHVSVDGSDLVLRASRNPSTAKLGVPGVNSGCITSNNRVLYPVFVEARVSVADIVLASDIWLLSPDDTQEIDIIECYGGDEQGNQFFSQFIHLSHHSFVRVPFTDYQPRDFNSWWARDGVSNWGEYCWNGGNRRYVRIGVNWISPFHFEYYVDGEVVRVLYDKAVATKVGNTWQYTYPTATNGNLDFESSGFQAMQTYATGSNYSFQTLQAASNASSVSIIDPYNFQGGNGFNKEQDIIINVESQDWHVLAGRTPTDAQLLDPARNKMLVDWIRVYKPVPSGNTDPGGNRLIVEAEGFVNTGGTFNDAFAGGPGLGVNEFSIGINYVNSGDWAEYNLNVARAGTYAITYRIATPSNGAQIQLLADGVLASTTNVPNNGQWDRYGTLSGGSVFLSAGTHTIRINASGSNTWQWNLDKITLVRVSGGRSSDKVIAFEPSESKKIPGDNEVYLYPNPVRDELKFTGQDIVRIVIYNMLGTEVVNASPENHSLDLSTLSEGIYSVKVIRAGRTETHRIIIER